jgi:hypothetical protein
MNGRPKGRHGAFLARREWSARLNRYLSGKSDGTRELAIEVRWKTNPGGTVKDVLQAWGYSPSARGRKAKDAPVEKVERPGRERLELALNELYGTKQTPVPSLYAKLAGRVDTTARDATRIMGALVYSWPEKIEPLEGLSAQRRKEVAQSFADKFIRDLLGELSAGRSHEWTVEEMETRTFRFVDEERVAARTILNEAGASEGALIVAGAKNILIGGLPVDMMRDFHELTSQLVGQDDRRLLIFVFNSAIFEAGKDGFNIIYNIGLLSSAIISFALFPQNYEHRQPIQQHEVDWSAWRALSKRCCVVIRKPPLLDPATGQFKKQFKFDEFISSWRPKQKFDNIAEPVGIFRFDSNHVLPQTYPFDSHDVAGKDLYWDVIVNLDPDEAQLRVQYFIPPVDKIEAASESQEGGERRAALIHRGRPALRASSIEEDAYYLVRKDSPGPRYDDAYRAIYMAGRGRLGLDVDDSKRHLENLNAAAALRQTGYEVLPISTMLGLLPRMLHSAASE